MFQEMLNDIQSSPEDYDWENATDQISERQQILERNFASTVAAFGVEVLDIPSEY